MDFWLSTSGYGLTPGKGKVIETGRDKPGAAISLDHWDKEKAQSDSGSTRKPMTGFLEAVRSLHTDAGIVTNLTLMCLQGNGQRKKPDEIYGAGQGT